MIHRKKIVEGEDQSLTLRFQDAIPGDIFTVDVQIAKTKKGNSSSVISTYNLEYTILPRVEAQK